jgi:hypothetical protein
MAPPDRDDHPRDTTPLNAAGIPEDSRMRRNAEKLASWVEWLLHPEEHDYDRTVIYPPNGDKVEEPCRMYRTGTANPKEIELPFESVIEGYLDVDFLRAMATVANQEVERGSSLLAIGTAALYNLWWLGNEGMTGLTSEFPSTWSGPASAAANDSLAGIKAVADQVSKIATDFRMMPAKYAAVITGLRDNANNAAGELVEAFESRFAEHDSVHMDIVGILVGAIAAATFTYLTGGAATPIVESAVGSAWSGTLGGAVSALQGDVGAFGGEGWRDTAKSYLVAQDDLLTEAKKAMDQVNGEVSRLLNLLKNDVLINQFLTDHGA